MSGSSSSSPLQFISVFCGTHPTWDKMSDHHFITSISISKTSISISKTRISISISKTSISIRKTGVSIRKTSISISISKTSISIFNTSISISISLSIIPTGRPLAGTVPSALPRIHSRTRMLSPNPVIAF